jgi:hypothetical protein
LAGTVNLCPQSPKEPRYVRPLLPFGLLGPQLYMKVHLFPALYLPFQLGLEGMPLAQKEAIDHLLGGFSARQRKITCKVSYLYLAAGELPGLASFFFLRCHEKYLLPVHCTRYPPFSSGRALIESP